MACVHRYLQIHLSVDLVHGSWMLLPRSQGSSAEKGWLSREGLTPGVDSASGLGCSGGVRQEASKVGRETENQQRRGKWAVHFLEWCTGKGIGEMEEGCSKEIRTLWIGRIKVNVGTYPFWDIKCWTWCDKSSPATQFWQNVTLEQRKPQYVLHKPFWCGPL